LTVASVTALIVVDVQRDFCEGGNLPVAGGATVAHGISEHLASDAGRAYRCVVATRDWHIDPGDHFAPAGTDPDYGDSWPEHCVAGSTGADWHPHLRLPDEVVVVSKGHYDVAYSGFAGQDDQGQPLDHLLRAVGVDTVDIVGIATSHCVRATALDAVKAGFTTRILTHLVADVDPDVTPATWAELRAAGVVLEGPPP
jgi:nicotinamidase/pyrazinamidase